MSQCCSGSEPTYPRIAFIGDIAELVSAADGLGAGDLDWDQTNPLAATSRIPATRSVAFLNIIRPDSIVDLRLGLGGPHWNGGGRLRNVGRARGVIGGSEIRLYGYNRRELR